MSKTVFEEIEDLFAQKMRDAVAEVGAEDPPNQDWGRIERMSRQYGGFLELFPEAIPPKEKPKPAKKAAKKSTSRSAPQVPVKKK